MIKLVLLLTFDIALIAIGWTACIHVLGTGRGAGVAAGMTVLIVVEAAAKYNERTTPIKLARRRRGRF